MKKNKLLFVSVFLLIFLFVGLPGKRNSGDALTLDSPETRPSSPAPYHPNDILNKPQGLRETEIVSEYGANKLMIYYVVPTDVPIDLDVRMQLAEASRDMQAWYQTATGGWTWDFASINAVEIYEAQESSQYYHDHDNWWGSLLPEMQASGLPIWSPGVVTTIWAHGAGWWAGGRQDCEGNCGVALLGVELFPQFNDPKFSGGTCPDPDGEGVEAWPCTPVGAFAHELGHTLGLIHPVDDPETAPYAAHSIMQTHWNYPDEAPSEDQPWGFLRTERLKLQGSPFMKRGIQVRQVYQDRESAVNLPPDGDPPLIKFDTVVDGGRLKIINNTEDALYQFWTFGDYQTSHENAPVHWYLETGPYNVILRASDSRGMMGTGRTLVDVLSLDPYEPNDSFEEAYYMLYGESFMAAIDDHDSVPFYEDKDYFRFFGFKEEAIAARADADYPSSNLWPTLCLLDEAGVDLACHSGQNYGELFYDLPETGNYFLKVDAVCGEGGSGCQGPYTLLLTQEVKEMSMFLPIVIGFHQH